MTSARAQAREIVPLTCEAAADAVSDIWEPLLRETVEHLRVWLPHHLRDSPMMRRLDDALGQGDDIILDHDPWATFFGCGW